MIVPPPGWLKILRETIDDYIERKVDYEIEKRLEDYGFKTDKKEY